MRRDSGPGTRDSALLEATLAHLKALVAFDTRNPPRAIGTDGIFTYLRGRLPGFDITVTDHGAGAVSMLAVRGQPDLLFNAHVDTVPAAPAWSRDPFELHVGKTRATGLGACDIKGAAAALLAVAQSTRGPMAMLFTSDEEANDPRCVNAFLESHPAVRVPDDAPLLRRTLRAIGCADVRSGILPPQSGSRVPVFAAILVAEPTRCRAVLAHRGIQSIRVRFVGRAGHASQAQAPGDSALHQAVRWGSAALEYVAAQADAAFDGLTGLRFNIGRIEGGIKANVIAPEATLAFNMRPLPDMDPDGLLAALRAHAIVPPVEFEETFRGPSLPGGDPEQAGVRRAAAQQLADDLGVPVGPAVDFWTEAALFSAAGYTTFVYGPGDIAQAHAADEWVALDELAGYAASIRHIVEGGQA